MEASREGSKAFKEEDLRYERVVIMTDADVDGAHIASLLITFFYRTMPQMIRSGRLYLALPPLYRLSHGLPRPSTPARSTPTADETAGRRSSRAKNRKSAGSRAWAK